MKYLHIFWHNELKFTVSFTQVINTNTDYFTSSDHFFVTPHSLIYDKISLFRNTELFISNSLTKIINRYEKHFEIIILHKMDTFTPLMISRKIAKKIIWRTWGGDIPSNTSNNPIKNLCKKLVMRISKFKIQSFIAVGCANVVDIYNVTQNYGITNTKIFPYFSSGDTILQPSFRTHDSSRNVRNILIGHSGFSINAHLEILRSLNIYFTESIKIFIPLSYGNYDYIAYLKKEIRNLDIPNDKIVIIDEFMSPEQYARLMSKMDIAIFAGNGSYALGNLTILSYIGTKLYFRRNGVIANALLSQNIQPNYLDDIKNMKYKEFIERDEEQIEAVRSQIGRVMSMDEKMQALKDLFDEALVKSKEI